MFELPRPRRAVVPPRREPQARQLHEVAEQEALVNMVLVNENEDYFMDRQTRQLCDGISAGSFTPDEIVDVLMKRNLG